MADESGCCCNPDVELILTNWPKLAALAFKGAVDFGRGTLIVDVCENKLEIHYLDASPCPCHAEWVNEYDPNTEAIIYVARPYSAEIYRLGGDLSPSEAYRAASGELLMETVQ